MTKIGLLSDTHSFLDPELLPLLMECDEIWHAGDVGDAQVLTTLEATGKKLRVVFGNIDGREIRMMATQNLTWKVENKKILMTHIGGYPGHYPSAIKKLLLDEQPDIFVCGHSHILRIMYDKEMNFLHINPGASGKIGFQKVRTMVRFVIDGDKIGDMAVIELGAKKN